MKRLFYLSMIFFSSSYAAMPPDPRYSKEIAALIAAGKYPQATCDLFEKLDFKFTPEDLLKLQRVQSINDCAAVKVSKKKSANDIQQ